jgi:hypothetical protein
MSLYSTASTNANDFIGTAQRQLSTAQQLVGTLASAVTTNNTATASGAYNGIQTFLGLATTNNNNAKSQIEVMYSNATDQVERGVASAFSKQTSDISTSIDQTRSQSQTLLSQLNTTQPGEGNNNNNQNAAGTSDDSAGQIVKDDQAAKVDNSDTQNPPPDSKVDNNGEDVATPPNSAQSNSDTPILTSTTEDANKTGAEISAGGDAENQPGGFYGNGTGFPNPDDQTVYTPASVGTSSSGRGAPPVAAQFLQTIIPQPNVLGKLATSTYTISLYLMNIQEYQQIIMTQRKVLTTQQLIAQSGGISTSSPIGVRNKYFDVDFFLDDLLITSLISPKGSGAPHNVAEFTLTIHEPHGVSFVPRLKAAVRDHIATGNQVINEFSQNFLMIIRFYGYDNNGKLLTGADLGQSESTSDPNAFVEKWIPFEIATLNWHIGAKGTEYKLRGVCPQQGEALSQMDATIPFNFELSAPTLNDLFNGKLQYGVSTPTAPATGGATTSNVNPGTTTDNGSYIPVDPMGNPTGQPPVSFGGDTTSGTASSTSAAPPKAGAAPTQTVTQGLCDALNKWQKDLAAKQGYQIPNVYEIIIEPNSGIGEAKLAHAGKQTKGRAPMEKSDDPATKLLNSKAKFDKNTKNFQVVAGTQITQLIDLAIRSSSYITSQQKFIFDEKTQQLIPQNNVATVQWYRIRTQATPLGYDEKRRRIAYKISYVISRYQINDPRSPYFPTSKFRGTHKLYNYWFSGQNTEVLDFDIDVNAQYYQTMGNDGIAPAPITTNNTTGAAGTPTDYTTQGPQGPNTIPPGAPPNYIVKWAAQTRPNESSQPGPGQGTMPAATLAERLYSYLDIAKSELTILGDPDWLQQAEIFYTRDIILDPFMPDGSVNTAASEILYELRWNPATDFDMQAGVMPVNQNNWYQTTPSVTGNTNTPSQSDIWAAAQVTSRFYQGKFTQKLIGNILDFNSTDRNYTINQLPAVSNTSRSPTVQKPNTSGTSGTATPEPLMWSDPMGTSDGAAIMDSVGKAPPKSVASQASGDDAVDYSSPGLYTGNSG